MPLPKGCPLLLDVLLKRPQPKIDSNQESFQRRVLHVQSISSWAPSCIGPYSQVEKRFYSIDKNYISAYIIIYPLLHSYITYDASDASHGQSCKYHTSSWILEILCSLSGHSFVVHQNTPLLIVVQLIDSSLAPISGQSVPWADIPRGADSIAAKQHDGDGGGQCRSPDAKARIFSIGFLQLTLMTVLSFHIISFLGVFY